VHIERTGRFHLPLAPDQALPLFSPGASGAGSPAGSRSRRAPDGDSRGRRRVHDRRRRRLTFWLVLEFDRARRAARYARITPGSRLGTVQVRCRDDGQGGTEVEVSYALTSLSPAGEAVLEGMTSPAYEEMLGEWNRKIRATL
jgi:hypothetical protein